MRPTITDELSTPAANGHERAAFRLRRRMTASADLGGTYVASCSWRTVVYKGLAAADALPRQPRSRAIELVVRGGWDIRHAVAMLIPEAWQGARDVDPEVAGLYRYHACLVEPWYGPAGIIFTDGVGVGAALDRNGLRPLRCAICEDGLVACCSEAGAIDTRGHGTVKRGRLGPGQMLFVDPTRGTLLDQECKESLAAAGRYARWAADGLRHCTRGK